VKLVPSPSCLESDFSAACGAVAFQSEFNLTVEHFISRKEESYDYDTEHHDRYESEEFERIHREHIERRWRRGDRYGWNAGPGVEQSQRTESLPDVGGEIYGQRRFKSDYA
jgi:hypothetical protein